MSPRPQRRFRATLTDTVVYTLDLTAEDHAHAYGLAAELFDEQGTDAFNCDQRYTDPDIDIAELIS